MSDLRLESFKQSHKILVPLQHEMVVLCNTIHFNLFYFCLLYEALAYGFSFIGYPKLPTYSHIDKDMFGPRTKYIDWLLKFLLIFGSFEGILGTANWKVRHLVISCVICSPFVAYDLFLVLFGRFHMIDAEDFLLFQTLLTSTYRTARVFTTLMNVAFFLQRLMESDTLTF